MYMMNLNRGIMLTIISTMIITFSACKPEGKVVSVSPSAEEIKAKQKQNSKSFHTALRKHTKAISDRDLETLKTMMSPDGLMHLIRPSTAVVYTTDNYIRYHESWFQDPNWSIKFSITDSEVGEEVGMAITDVLYEVPDRNGKPYWNKMVISFVLKKMDGNWYVISDHSGSVQKSTDS